MFDTKLPNMWLEGPSWLTNSSEWANQPIIQSSLEFQNEAKLEKQIVVITIETTSAFDKYLEKYELHKPLRVSAWVNRFIKNCHHSKQSDPLTTSEIEKQRKFYIISEQKRLVSSEKFQQDRKSFNLVQNTDGIFECIGRIQESYPIYLPKESLLTEKLFLAANKKNRVPGSRDYNVKCKKILLDTITQQNN